MWGIALVAIAIATAFFVVRRWGRINRGRAKLDLYVWDLPLPLMAALHDHTHLLLQVELAISPASRRWKSMEAYLEILTALRRGAALHTDPEFTLARKNRYRIDLGSIVAKFATTQWKDEFTKDAAERAALRPFELPTTFARGDYSDSMLEDHIEKMGALI